MKKIIIISLIIVGLVIPILILGIGSKEIKKPMTLDKKEIVLKDKIVIQKKDVITLEEWRNQAPQLLLKEVNNSGKNWAEFLREFQGKEFHIIIKGLNKNFISQIFGFILIRNFKINKAINLVAIIIIKS